MPGGLRKVLDAYGLDTAEVSVRNMIFPGTAAASSGNGSVVERYTQRHREAVPQGREKVLVRPQAVRFLWAHFASQVWCGKTHHLRSTVLRANHYIGAVAGYRNQTCPGGCVPDASAAR